MEHNFFPDGGVISLELFNEACPLFVCCPSYNYSTLLCVLHCDIFCIICSLVFLVSYLSFNNVSIFSCCLPLIIHSYTVFLSPPHLSVIGCTALLVTFLSSFISSYHVSVTKVKEKKKKNEVI